MSRIVNKDILVTLLCCTLVSFPVVVFFICFLGPMIHITTREQVLRISFGVPIILDLFIFGAFISGAQKAYEHSLLSDRQIEMTNDYYQEWTVDGEKKVDWEVFLSIVEKRSVYILLIAGEIPRVWEKKNLKQEQIDILKVAMKKNKEYKMRGKEILKHELEEELAVGEYIYEVSYPFKIKLMTIYYSIYDGILPQEILIAPIILSIVTAIGRAWNFTIICGLLTVSQLLIILIISYMNGGFKENIGFMIFKESGIWLCDETGKQWIDWKFTKGIMEIDSLFYIIKEDGSRLPIPKQVLNEGDYNLLKEKVKSREYFKQYLKSND